MKKTYLVFLFLLLAPGGFAQDVEKIEEAKPKVGQDPAVVEPKVVKPDTKEGDEVKLPQEAEAKDKVDRPKIPILPPGVSNKERESAEKIMELFKQVDEKMKAIDEFLFDIGAGEVPLTLPEDSGLGALLDLTRSASNDVVKDIDEILKIAAEMGKSKSKPGGQGQRKPGQSGQPQQQGQGKPGDEPKPDPKAGDKPGEDGEPKQEEGKDPKDPKSGKESEEPGKNQPGAPAPGDPTIGPGSKANMSERWGELPERTRETFRNQGGDDLPLFYRDWIESYYKHLNRSDSRGN